MAWIKNMKWIGSLIVLIGILTACSVSYKFNGASIDYAKTKTISFENFPNRSVGFVWGPMENMFNTALQVFSLPKPFGPTVILICSPGTISV